MGRLDVQQDPTGKMNILDLNTQNIQNIIDELNRNSDQLDSLTNQLSIVQRSSVKGTWNGIGGINSGLILTVNHGLAFAPIWMGFFTRSDQPGQYFSVPNWEYDNAGLLLGRAYGYTTSSSLFFQFARTNNGPTIDIVLSYYFIQQPANVPTGA
jgi:hypothetical protein